MKTKTVKELERQHDKVHALDMPEADKNDTLEGIEGEMVEAHANEQQLEEISNMAGKDIAALYTDPEAFQKLLDSVREAATSFEYDPSTKKGRTTCRSVARKVSSAKVRLVDAGAELTADWVKKKAKVDASRNKAKIFCDALRDEIKAPAVEWEERVAAEKAAVEADLQYIRDHDEALHRDDLYDREQKMLAFEAKQRADELAAEAKAEEARVLAQLKERAALEAAEAVKAAEERAAEAERQLIINAENVKKREADAAMMAEGIKKAAIERVEREARDKAKAEEDARIAHRVEQAQEAAARAADKAHRNAVNMQIVDYFVSTGVVRGDAVKIVELIGTGIVPNLSIAY